MARHEALRTTFFAVEGEGRQRVCAAETIIPLPVIDLRGEHDAQARLLALIDAEGSKPFDLAVGP
ncbi:amino acid adenylation, partial [Pseudomonas syringae pv. japonica str. M301072]